MNPAIVSCTITGPGMKARPPMATYVKRAKAAQIDQRWQREYDEAMQLIAKSGFEPFPPTPEMPAKLALHQELQPDAQFSARYLSLLIGFALGAASAVLFEAGRQ